MSKLHVKKCKNCKLWKFNFFSLHGFHGTFLLHRFHGNFVLHGCPFFNRVLTNCQAKSWVYSSKNGWVIANSMFHEIFLAWISMQVFPCMDAHFSGWSMQTFMQNLECVAQKLNSKGHPNPKSYLLFMKNILTYVQIYTYFFKNFTQAYFVSKTGFTRSNGMITWIYAGWLTKSKQQHLIYLNFNS